MFCFVLLTESNEQGENLDSETDVSGQENRNSGKLKEM